MTGILRHRHPERSRGISTALQESACMRRTFPAEPAEPAEPVEPVEHVEPVKPNASGLLGDSRKTIHADGTLTTT